MVGYQAALLVLAALGGVEAGGMPRPSKKPAHLRYKTVDKRSMYPKTANTFKTIVSPANVTIRYKEPGKHGVCETTPGVNSYAGYIELGPYMHSWFWFFESRNKPATDPVTLWLNGGPGSDSQIGLFQELGPCFINKELQSYLNPHSWNEVSNFIFLSQPYGTGFSYSTEDIGSISDNVAAAFVNSTYQTPDGRWPIGNYSINTTNLAAEAAWNIIQGLYSALPQLDSQVKSSEFNLWTESYGGHYGPAFFDYFQQQNDLVGQGKLPGKHLTMNSLGIGNGIINEKIQVPYYPDFAENNTYGIKSYNDTIYTYTQVALYMPYGCIDQIDYCYNSFRDTAAGIAVCAEAAAMCRDNVEQPYYNFAGRGVYDIRHPIDDPTPPSYFVDYLNQAEIQDILGVNLNYTTANDDTYWAFQQTGDFVYPDFLKDLSRIIDSGVVVNLYYGDADYICNWFGGQAISENVPYKHHKEFLQTGYVPFVVDGKEYGSTRQYGNFSFTRIYEAGHEVPWYQPKASLALFNRTINHFDIATGTKIVTPDYGTKGKPSSTHTEPYVPLPKQTGSSTAASARRRYPRVINW